MISKIIDTIQKNNLIQNGDTVIVALSGGADSVTLLHSLNVIRSELGFSLRAAHLNHNIRGQEAIRDMDFCNNICSQLDIPIDIKSVDVLSVSNLQKISVELAGRNERYKFFAELSDIYNNVKIATAHTASDNIETVIFNLARGTGIDGLCGIPVRRDNIIRPLIDLTRANIEEYCQLNSLEYVTDSTNLEQIYNRNKIRESIVPILRQLNLSVEDACTRMCRQMADISDYLSGQTLQALDDCRTKFGYSCGKLIELPNAIRDRALILIAKNAGVENLGKKHIDLCADIVYNSGIVNLPNDFFAISKQGIFRISQNLNAEKFVSIELKNNTSFYFNDKFYSFEFSDIQTDGSFAVDFGLPIVLRNRQDGDTFTLPYRNVTKTLKKLFNELKIPSESRNSLLLLEQNSNIIWIEGIGSSKIKIDGNKKYLKININ